MKKIVSLIIGLSMVAAPAFAFATTTPSASVQALIDQIKLLQTQIQSLQTAQNNVASTTIAIRNLRKGMSGDDVKALQAILAADPTIFQGGITGFFGPLTEQGLKKWQKKNGLEGVGFVGPRTLNKLFEELNHLGLKQEKDDENENHATSTGNKICIPPGHEIAPGWQKHHDDQGNGDLPSCKHHGEDEHGDNNKDQHATSTPKLTTNASASVMVGGNISDVAHLRDAKNPTGTITFNVYGPGDTSCVSPLSPAIPPVAVNGNGDYLSLNFVASTSGLYKFVAMYSGDNKNTSVSTSCNDSSESVVVTAQPDTTAPVISNVMASSTTASTTQITWTTNEAATGKIWYGTSNPLNLGSASMIFSGSLVTSHTGNIMNLATSTTYFYVVVSSDGSGNTATSSQGSFTTLSI